MLIKTYRAHHITSQQAGCKEKNKMIFKYIGELVYLVYSLTYLIKPTIVFHFSFWTKVFLVFSYNRKSCTSKILSTSGLVTHFSLIIQWPTKNDSNRRIAQHLHITIISLIDLYPWDLMNATCGRIIQLEETLPI